MRSASASCPPESVLGDFSLGKLDDSSAAAVGQHVQVCVACRERVAALLSNGPGSRANKGSPGKTLEWPRASFARGESIGHSLEDSQIPPDSLPAGPALSVEDTPPGTNTDVAPPELSDLNYEVLRRLGRGALGTVFLARNCLMDRLEALKVIDPALLERSGARESFEREIRATACLNHVNIVAAYRLLRAGGSLALAMEYVEGQDLARLVARRGPLPVTNAAYYAHQAARGLEHAFRQGLVHHRIQPSNLMLAIEDKKHVIKILDFGLAKAGGRLVGKSDYLAREQMGETSEADIRADMYGLGCTLYFLLSGQAPSFAQSGRSEADRNSIARRLTNVRPEIPSRLADIVVKMMAQNPAERYQTPGEAAKALVPFFKAAATHAPAIPAPRPIATAHAMSPIIVARRRTRKARRPALFAVIAIGSSLAVLVLGMIAAGLREPDKVAQLEPAPNTPPVMPTPEVEKDDSDTPSNKPEVEPPESIPPALTNGGSEQPAPSSTRPSSAAITAAELKKSGVYGFPQRQAKVVCDNDDLRVSLWNNREYLYVQAIVWNDREDVTDTVMSDNSKLTLVTAADLSITPNVDRRYHLATRTGFGASVLTATSQRFGPNTRGRGAIRYLDLDDGRCVRVDSLLVPLREINKQPRDQVGVGFQTTSFNPFVVHESKRGGGLQAVTLVDNAESLDPKDVTRGRPRAADGQLDPIAQFLFNGNGQEEVSDATVVTLTNTEFRDDALFLNGRHAIDGGGRETTVQFATEIMDLRHFTVALRINASDFEAGHETLISADFPSFFRLFRSPQGNLCVSLGQTEYVHEFAGAKIAADRWMTVVCGVDLEGGKCIAYIDGEKAGESEIPQASNLRNVGWARPRLTFGDYTRGPVYHGLVDELIVYDKLLSPDEFAKVPLRIDTTSAAVSRHPRKAAEEALAQAAARTAAAEYEGVPAKLVAHFLFNGDAKEEVRQNSFSVLENVEFRDGALYLSGKLPADSNVDMAGLTVTAPLDVRHFTVVLRFKAEDFGEKHNLILGYDWDGWFALNRLPSGNLGFHLAGGAFYREVTGALLEPGKWTVVAFGVDLNLGKAVVYFNGARVGEFEVPTTLERRKSSDPARRLQFWMFRRLDQCFHGLVDELLVYDQLLSDDEFEWIPLQAAAAREDRP